MSLAIVLLAAGDSRRFQNIKQLAMIDGELLITNLSGVRCSSR